MAADNLTVAGRRFRTQADYQAALRDFSKIEKIKAETDLKSPKRVYELFHELQAGVFRFETVVGNDFDDEIYAMTKELEKDGITEENAQDSSRTINKSLKRLNTKGNKKAAADKKQAIKKTSEVKADREKLKEDRARQKANKTINLNDFDSEMQKQILNELKKREQRRRITVIAASLTAVLCFSYFGIYYFFMQRTGADYASLSVLKNRGAFDYQENTYVHRTSDDTPDIIPDLQDLYNKNKKLIGWLQIADTIINYPVMQTHNNEYYLTYNFNQKYDKNGSIFLDAACSIYPRSTNLILYGHHMKSGQMFGQLQKYAKEDYYKEHKSIQFDSLYEKGTYEIMYVFRSQVYNENDVVFKYYQFINANSEAEFQSNMSEMAKMSLYDTGVTASYGDSLLTLSTCDNSQEDGRFVVVAKKGEFQ